MLNARCSAFCRNDAPPASLPPPDFCFQFFSAPAFQRFSVSVFSFSPGGGRRVGRGRPEPLAPPPHFRSGRSSVALPAAGNSPLPHTLKRDQVQSVRARGRGALLAADRASGPHPPLSGDWNVSAGKIIDCRRLGCQCFAPALPLPLPLALALNLNLNLNLVRPRCNHATI